MRSAIILGIITAAFCCILAASDAVHGQTGSYVAENGRRYNWCPPGTCSMCDRNRVRYGFTQRTTVTTTQPATEYELVQERYQSGTMRQCINGVCSVVPIYSTRMVRRAVTGRQTKTEPAATGQPRRTGQSVTTEANQGASTPEQIAAMLAALDLTPCDRLADIGCGDGRVVIAAVEQYGCTAVGIEIDPVSAAKARRNVLQAVAEHRIADGSVTIITGDGLHSTPADVTAAVVYLWPDTLEELRPVLERIPRVVSLNHPIPGRTGRTVGAVYVYETRQPAAPIAIPTTVYTGGIQVIN